MPSHGVHTVRCEPCDANFELKDDYGWFNYSALLFVYVPRDGELNMPYFFRCPSCNLKQDVTDINFGDCEQSCEDCGEDGCNDCMPDGVCEGCVDQRDTSDDEDETEY